MKSFSQRLTHRIVIALTLVLIIIIVGTTYMALRHHNLPIGAMPDWEFEAEETDLAPGSTLFLYTDGLDEAEKAEYQMFGKKRIYEVMQTSSQQPHMLIERMTQAVADFVGDTEQSDDLTMLAIQWKK